MSSFTVTSGSQNSESEPSTRRKLHVNAAPWSPSANPPSGKFALCNTFIQNGFCGDSKCVYAHTFDELDPVAQSNVLIMMNAHHTASGAHLHYSAGHFDTEEEEISPSSRRVPLKSAMKASSHNTSSASAHYPPSPGSQSSEISSVSSSSVNGQTSSANTHSSVSNYGPQTSPFIKSQMYYSQNASRPLLPERCRYPHATPGTYYDYLNVKRSVAREDIERKYQSWRDDGYKKAASINVEKADAMDRLIVEAKTILCNDRMRAEYDQLLPPLEKPFISPSHSNEPSPCSVKPMALMTSDVWSS